MIKITSIRRLHAIVAQTKLNSNVPTDVADHFTQAQNLTVYAWFNYTFHSSAQLLALATLEFALRRRFKSDRAMLSKLLARAIDEKLISESLLSSVLAPADSGSLTETIREVLPRLRNGYAHGSDAANPFSITCIRLVSVIVNALFPRQ